MYFLEQLKNQFSSCIVNYETNPTDGFSGAASDPIEQDAPVPQPGMENGIPQTGETLAFQELNEELDAIDNDSGLVNKYTNILGNFLVKVRNGEIEGLSEDDSDFQRLLSLYKNKFEELKDMRNRGHMIEMSINQEISQLNSAVDKGAKGEDIDDMLDSAYEEQIEDKEKQEELERLETERDSYLGILNEKMRELPSYITEAEIKEQYETPILKLINRELNDSEGNDLGIEDKISALGDINPEILNKFGSFDQYIQNNTPETIYSTTMVENMKTNANTKISSIREVFFVKILGEEISDIPFINFKDHDRIKGLIQETDGLEYGYDIIPLLEKFDAINLEDFTEVIDDNKQTLGTELATVLWKIDSIERDFGIIERDIQVVEGEKTFGETRIESTHEYFDSIMLNEQGELTELGEKIADGLDRLPAFEDLNSVHIQIMMDAGIDMKKIFLSSTETGKPWDKSELGIGDSFVINFGINKELASEFDFSYLDITASIIELDGKQLRFREKGEAVEAGYYDENNNKYPLQDGSLIKIIELREDQGATETTRLQEQVRERLGYEATQDANYGAFVEAAYGNPDDDFLGITFPKGIAGIILGNLIAMIQSLQLGIKLKYDPETRKIVKVTEDGSEGDTLSNREVAEAYIGNISVGTLSAKYEGGSSGSYAYNPDDNGHGPSYGTFQMNSQVGVYKPFIEKYGITEGQVGWNAAVEKYGKAEFQKMEIEHIKQYNYIPMMNHITIQNKDNFSLAMQNVIYSCAVQHGPNRSSIYNLINNSGVIPGDKNSEADLIHKIYEERGNLYKHGRAGRYKDELVDALRMLNTVAVGGIISEGSIYDQGLEDITQPIKSFPKETSPSGTSLCSKTARLNLSEKLGIRNVQQGNSAKDSFHLYPSDKIQPFPPTNNIGAKVADFYVDTNPNYWHRVAAYNLNGSWVVLDPYYGDNILGESRRNDPIPADQYIKYMQDRNRDIKGAAYFS